MNALPEPEDESHIEVRTIRAVGITSRKKNPKWETIAREYPQEIIAAIEQAGLAWLLVPIPENAETMTWLWTNFISRSEAHPHNKHLNSYNYPDSYDVDYETFYGKEGRACIGRIMLKEKPMFVSFSSGEIPDFQRLAGVLNNLGVGIFNTKNPNQMFTFSMSAPE